MMDMTGKTALVTGASRGIGAAAARQFAAQGAKVVLVARSSAEIEAIASEIGGVAVAGDVADAALMRGAVGKATVSSGAAHAPMEGWGQYCVSKAAINMLTRAVHKENAGSGIRAIGLSPGTVATEMQVIIKASGINPVSQLDPSVHIPAEWPAKAVTWMCEPDVADEFDGQEISLRDEDIRRRIGLID